MALWVTNGGSVWLGAGLYLGFAMCLHEYEIPPDVLLGYDSDIA